MKWTAELNTRFSHIGQAYAHFKIGCDATDAKMSGLPAIQNLE
jgi:hypothetical protein